MRDLTNSRLAMVEAQLRRRGIADDRVLRAMSEVRRELFVAPGLARKSYDDRPLPIASGQTISQPYIVALMLEQARICPDDNVLEVGTGSGYVAAVLAHLARSVHTIERDVPLFEAARSKLGSRVQTHLGDGSQGWPAAAPYDVIIVSAAVSAVPVALREQLALGGRMLIPVADAVGQRLVKLTRGSEKEVDELQDLGAVLFVPMIYTV